MAWLTLAAVGTPSSVSAFSITTSPPSSKTTKRWLQNKVYYYLNQNCSEDLEKKKCLDTIRKGFEGWMDPKCGALKFAEGYQCNLASKTCLFDSKYGKPLSCKSDTDCPAAFNNKLMTTGHNPNKRNEINFAEGSDWPHGSFVLGVTIAYAPSWNGAIAEADITLNGKDHKWTTNPYAAGKNIQDLLSVVIHEEGHFFGVQHVLGNYNPKDLPTMAPNVFPQGISETLSVDDKKAICFLNPTDGKYKCKSDSDCPYILKHDNKTGKEYYAAKMLCKSGICVWGSVQQAPKAPLGGDCNNSNECESGLFCQSYGAHAYCAQYCKVSQGNCPSGFSCFGYKNSKDGTGACLPGQGGGGSKAAGSACKTSGECASLMCLQGICRNPCDGTNASQKCDLSNEICQPVPGTNGGVCMPKTSGSGKKILGSECSGPEECDSNLCMKDDLMAQVGHCRKICSGPNTCPFNFKCVQQAAGYQGCLPGNETWPTGAPCSYTNDCAVGPCIPGKNGGASFCTAPCKLKDPASCPCGMACESTPQGPRCYVGKPVKCLKALASCSSASECLSGICEGGSCRATCNLFGGESGSSSCAADEGCLRLVPGAPDGMCWPRGTVADAGVCGEDKACQGLFCAADASASGALRCMKPCVPAGATGCGEGQTCVSLSEKIGVCQLASSDPKPAADAVGATDLTAGFVPATGGASQPQSPGCSVGRTGSSFSWGGLLALFAALSLLAGSRRRVRRKPSEAMVSDAR